MAELGHLELADRKIDALQDQLESYQPWYAAKAEVLIKMGQVEQAAPLLEKAIDMAANEADRKLLLKKKS